MAKPEIVLDFETFYSKSYSLSQSTYVEYIADPRFKIHGLGIRYPDGRMAFRADAEQAVRELQHSYGERLEGAIVVVHNGAFDLLILRMKFGVSVANFLDTQWLAYQVNGRKEGGDGESATLEHLAEKHNLPVKKGDLDFMRGVAEPAVEQLLRLEQYTFGDLEITYNVLQLYKPKITRPELEIPLMLHTMRLFVERGVNVDLPALHRLRGEITEQLTARLKTADADEKSLSSNTKFAARMTAALARTGRSLPTKPGKKGAIPACAKTDTAMQAFVNDSDPAVKALACARLDLKSFNGQIARLDTMERIVQATGGDLKAVIVYYGARTGRFSGGGGWNIHNIAKKGMGGKIRGLLVPHDGCVFIVCDLSQIEARVIAWMAGQEDLVQQFREYDVDPSKDVYCRFAAEAFQCEVRPAAEDDTPEKKDQLSTHRQIGKQAVLGLGFGMGALTFMSRLKQAPILATLFDTGVLTPKVCVDTVRIYRATFPRIPELWRNLESAVVSAVSGQRQSCNGMAFFMDGTTLNIQLPSGRVLHYPDARLVERHDIRQFLNSEGEIEQFESDGMAIVYGNNIGFYGGKITENLVQATARDLFVENMLRLERQGRKVLWHTHDEVVFEVARNDAEVALGDVEKCMCTAPDWANGLPLAVSASIYERYDKS